MALICYDVDNLILYHLSFSDISHLVQTNKYWQKRAGWLVKDYEAIRMQPNYLKLWYSLSELACYYGKFRILKWLWFKGICIEKPINIHSKGNTHFSFAMRHRNLEIAKWIYNNSIEIGSPIDIRANHHVAFRSAQFYGKTSHIDWLCSIEPRYSFIDGRPAFDGQIIADEFSVLLVF